MKGLFFICGIWLFLAIELVHAVPARPLYEPEPKPKAPTPMVVDLRGSAWIGKYLTATTRIFIFEADGTLSYKSSAATATVFRNRGNWRLEGNVLYFEHTVGINKVMDFRGVIQDQNSIAGESVNKAGTRTMQTLKRTTLTK